MAELKNLRHEFFCRTFMESLNESIRFNATKSYMEVYPMASKKTAATNGPRLKAKCRERLLELWEDLLRRKGGHQLQSYRRGVKKNFNLNSQRSTSTNASRPRPIIQPQAQQDAPKPYEIPKHQRDQAANNSDRDPWDVLSK